MRHLGGNRISGDPQPNPTLRYRPLATRALPIMHHVGGNYPVASYSLFLGAPAQR